MSKILIFGGTTEGRQLAEYCEKMHVSADISVATEYGADVLSCGEYISILVGRLDFLQMKNLMFSEQYSLVIDATHPYAVAVTENIKMASTATNTPYHRLTRLTYSTKYGIRVDSVSELVDELNKREGIVLSTLGSKELDILTAVENFRERIWIRALPSTDIAELCAEKGFDKAKLILEKGPFSLQENIQHIRKSGATILITKESGNVGGFSEKVNAAVQTGVTLITIARPPEIGCTFDEILEILENYR